MTRHHLLSIAYLSVSLQAVQAQTFDNGHETWNERNTNEVSNVSYFSKNPVRVADNSVQNYGVARVAYGMGRGDFHAPHKSGHVNGLDVYIGGLKRIANFSLSGFLDYTNTSRNNQRWDSTLGANPYNPLILGDSISSDRTIEQFRMNVTGAMRLSDAWTLGLSIDLFTGRLSDQSDPRPETSTSEVPVTLGVSWQASERMSAGISAGARFLRSDISHTIIDPLVNYSYFLMKGNGDYYRRSSADVNSYDREYSGNYYNAALQVQYRFRQHTTDFLELSYETGNENAMDEGSTPFHGGDYKPSSLSFSNRLMLDGQNGHIHNVILSADYISGNAIWYDQKKVVDTEHANRNYYQVLSSYTVQKNKTAKGQLEYRLDYMNDRQRLFFVDAALSAENFKRTHYGSRNNAVQKATLFGADIAGGYDFHTANVKWQAVLRAGYTMPAGDSYADASSYASENISSAYSRPLYAYETASQVRVGATVNASLPVSKVMVGAYVKADSSFFCGDDKYESGLESAAYTTVETGLYLRF